MMFFGRRQPTSYARPSWRSFLRNQEGVSAIEFAFIAPLMLMVYFGCVELSFLMRADRKVTAAAASLGDLTTRLVMVTNTDLEELLEAAAVLMEPYPVGDTRIRITSVVDNGDGQQRVAWSDGHNMTARAEGTSVTIPDGILPSPGSLIMTEVEYDYASRTGIFLNQALTMSDTFYLRPRRVTEITRLRGEGSDECVNTGGPLSACTTGM